MKHLTPYRQNETSLSPVRGRGMGLISSYREQINSFYPVLYIKTIDMTKVLHIVSYYRQTGSFRSTVRPAAFAAHLVSSRYFFIIQTLCY